MIYNKIYRKHTLRDFQGQVKSPGISPVSE